MKNEEVKKPEMSLLMAYGTVREKMVSYLAAVRNQFPIPGFMVEGILSGMLADVRSEVLSQLSGEREAFDSKTAVYYEAEMERLKAEQQELIASFEGKED